MARRIETGKNGRDRNSRFDGSNTGHQRCDACLQVGTVFGGSRHDEQE